MAGAKLIVMYPIPKDLAAFEQLYGAEHIPMAAPVFKAAGATRAVLTKVINAAAGSPTVHRIAEIHFPSMEALQACTASKAGADVLEHARTISNGGPPLVLIAEEEVVKFVEN